MYNYFDDDFTFKGRGVLPSFKDVPEEEIFTPKTKYEIEQKLTSAYPLWKEKLGMFFPFADYTLWKKPLPEMLLLLAKAFNLELSKEAKKEVDKLMGNGKGEGEGDEGEGESEGKGEGEGEGDGETSSKPGKPSDRIDWHARKTRQELQQEFRKLMQEGSKLGATTDAVGNLGSIPDYREVSDDFLDVEPTIENSLANLLKKRLITLSRVTPRYNVEDGELDEDELIGATQKRLDVFQELKDGKSNNIAMMVSLDHSGSMGGHTDRYQAMAASNIVAALDRLKVPTYVSTFGNGHYRIRGWGDPTPLTAFPAGWSSHEHPQMAYRESVDIFKTRHEKRKLLLIISDGSVWPDQCRKHRNALKQANIEPYLFCLGWSPFADGVLPQEYRDAYDSAAFAANAAEVESNLYHYIDQLFQ
jgi:hypothetical protein